MKVLIVEDEQPAARHLQRCLDKVDESINILGVLESIEEAVSWLSSKPAPDLLFLDIQLADGLCFKIFEQVDVTSPVIFTTAFDEYALKAFQVRSIDYLLKPIQKPDLSRALAKLRTFTQPVVPLNELLDLIKSPPGKHYQKRILIRTGDKFRYIPIAEIKCLHLHHGLIEIWHGNTRSHLSELTLDEVLELLDPEKFFRINRQQIVHIDAIQSIERYFNGRLKLDIDQISEKEFIVSRDRTRNFRKWIEG